MKTSYDKINYDKASTLAGMVFGIIVILGAFNIISADVKDALMYASPFLVSGVSTIVLGWMQNKVNPSKSAIERIVEDLLNEKR